MTRLRRLGAACPVIVAGLLVLAIGACGSDDSSSGASAATGGTTQGGLPAPEKNKLVVGLSDIDVGEAPTIIAAEESIYKKYGLDVEVRVFDGASKVTQALVAGQIQAACTSGGPVLASIPTDRPLIMPVIWGSAMDYLFVANKNVHSAADLRGKSVAISTFGAISHAATLVALGDLGLKTSDVTITQVGGTSERFAALVGGSAAAAPFVRSERPNVIKEGNHVIVDLKKGDHKTSVASVGLATLKSFADENPNTVTALVAANLEATKSMIEDPATAGAAYGKFAKLDAAEATSQVKEEATSITPRDGRPTAEMFKTLVPVVAKLTPSLANVDVSKAFTTQYIDALDQKGVLKKITAPSR